MQGDGIMSNTVDTSLSNEWAVVASHEPIGHDAKPRGNNVFINQKYDEFTSAPPNDPYIKQQEEIEKVLLTSRENISNILLNAAGGGRLKDLVESTHAIVSFQGATGIEHNSITSQDGISVAVETTRISGKIQDSALTIKLSNGSDINIHSKNDLRMQTGDDGSLLIEDLITHDFLLFAKDGSKIESTSSNCNFDMNKDSIYIQLTEGSNINSGEGNDSVLVIAGGGNINTGAGEDNIIVSTFIQNATNINAGDGDDQLSGELINSNVLITMGNGNDHVEIQQNSGTIDLGEGNNAFLSHGSYLMRDKKSRLIAGNGNNTITANSLANVYLGDGNNNINANNVYNLQCGDGINKIEAESVDTIELGCGDNQLISGSINKLKAGNGNNNIISNSISGDNQLGNGNNSLKADFISESILSLGDGDNDIAVGSINSSLLYLGDGTNHIAWRSTFLADMFIGNGNNTVKGNIGSSFTNISIGGGNNIIELSYDARGETFRPNLYIGNGDNNINIDNEVELHNVLFDRVTDKYRHSFNTKNKDSLFNEIIEKYKNINKLA